MKNISREQKLQIINKITKETNPKRNISLNMAKAFLIGGSICAIGEVLRQMLLMRYNTELSGNIMIILMIITSALLTGFGIYDRIGQIAGCGTIIPITGFANSIASPAIEFKSEGYVLGVGAKLFQIAGPVLVYGISTSIVVGLIYFLFTA